MEADTERVIRSFYGPSVGLLCSSDGAACIGRNGIKIEHLFQPFSTLNGDLTSRDISVSQMRLRFINLDAAQLDEESLNARLEAAIGVNTESGKERVRFENGTYNLNVGYSCPWFTHYRDLYLHFAKVFPHERIRHTVATMLIVSSENDDPMTEFRKLSDHHRQLQLDQSNEVDIGKRSKFWFSESTVTLFLLVHDVHQGSEAKAQEVLANLKQTFGDTNAFLLRINSNGEKGPDPWAGFLQRMNPGQTVDHERLCGLKDHDALRALVRDIAIGAVIPHLEKEARKLHDIIQNRKALHRSIFSATKKFFGGSNTKNYVTEKYAETVEIQTRRLADLCFLLQQYELASTHYQSAKRDLSNEQNWIEATSASEFAALASFMAGGGQRENFPKQVTAHAINSYFNLNQTTLAIRSAITTLEAVRSVGAYIDAAKDYLRFSRLSNPHLVGLFTEQAALCYLKAGHARQFAFQSILAGHQYNLAGQRQHSLRCYRDSVDVYTEKGWKSAELHVYEIMAEHSKSLGDTAGAEKSYTMALALKCGQNPSTLRDYLAMVKRNNNTDSAVESQFPEIKNDQTAVTVKRFDHTDPTTFGLRYKNSLLTRQVERMRVLEEQCKKAASDGIIPISYKPTMPIDGRNQFTFNDQPLPIDCSDSFVVTIPFYNQLHNTLQLSNFTLLFECENGTVSSHRCDQQDETLLLDANVTISLQFEVKPNAAGMIRVTGVEYDLTTPDVDDCDVIRAKQMFHIRGCRLNKTQTQRKGVFYNGDNRFQIKVYDSLPRINLRLASALPSSMLSEEVYPFTIVARNDGTCPARRCWLNHTYGDNIQLVQPSQIVDQKQTVLLSSLNGLVDVEDIMPGEERRIDFFLRCPRQAEKKLIEIVFYCDDDSEKPVGQCVGMSFEHNVVGNIGRKVTILPAPVGSSKRVLQVQLDTASEESDVTCRYIISGCGMLSNRWQLVTEHKQPSLSVSWIQGQNTGFLVFVTAEESDHVSTTEETNGRRCWRRKMTKTTRYTEVFTDNPLIHSFFGSALEFTVPAPIPEDDVIEHVWLDKLKEERIAILLQWKAEIIDENGMRIAIGQSAVTLRDIYQVTSDMVQSPVEPPIRCYILAPNRVEHDFTGGPMKLTCTIELENNSRTDKKDLEISFRHPVEAASTGFNNNVSFTWVGFSEKKATIGPLKTCQFKNNAIFTRPGTFDLSNFTVTNTDLPIIPRSHIIVVNDT